MLESMCGEFKAYHYDIVDSLDSDEEAARKQAVFDEHQRKTMKYIDRLGDLLAKPQPDVPSLLSTNNRLVDRQLESLEGSAQDVRRAVETPRIERYVLTNYLVEIESLKRKLEALEKEILSLEDYEERKSRATRIERSLFEASVVITRLTEEPRKEPTSDRIGMPMMAGMSPPAI